MTFHSTNFPQDPTWSVIYYLACIFLLFFLFFFRRRNGFVSVPRVPLFSERSPGGRETRPLCGLRNYPVSRRRAHPPSPRNILIYSVTASAFGKVRRSKELLFRIPLSIASLCRSKMLVIQRQLTVLIKEIDL